jgi:signal transduction histidine kinase/ligand-binding sensor domain-containing protein/DNA-binding response OmpR family regulator
MKLFFAAFLFLTSHTVSKCCDVDFIQNYSFKYLSVNNGLSQNSITSIMQDSKGFIWIGTYDGLNRFDGFAIRTKRHVSNNKNSLSDNRILSIHESSKGEILIGTDGGGLNILDPALDQISRINISTQQSQSNVVRSLSTDANDRIWAGSERGLAIISRSWAKNTPVQIFYPQILKNRNIRSLLKDKSGNMWIGTDLGLFVYTPVSTVNWKEENLIKISDLGERMVTSLHQSKQEMWIGTTTGLFHFKSVKAKTTPFAESLSAMQNLTGITGIDADANGNIWISTMNSGLVKLSPDSAGNMKRREQYITQRPFCNIAENAINTVFIDRSNTLWAGTYQKGINYTDLSPKKFYSFYPLMSNEQGVFGYRGRYISTVLETADDVWTGTLNEGLLQYNKCTKKLTAFKTEINSEAICSILETRDKSIWVGGSDGLYKVESGPNGKRIRTVKNKFVARSMCEDNFGNIWISTWDGVVKYNPATDEISRIAVKDGLSSNSVYIVYKDPFAPIIWAGTIGGGLNSIEYNEKGASKILVYKHQETDANALSSNHIWCLYRDKANALWVGTDAGLNRLTINAKAQVTGYRTINETPIKDRKIMAILEDDSGNLWLSGSQGLFRYHVTSGTTHQYTYQDGLQSNTLTEAVYKNKDGLLYFGGINGLNYFKPQDKTDKVFPSITAFTDFRIFNKSVRIGEKVDGDLILENDINHTKTITLSHKQRDFSIAFASLHFAASENNKFRYKLEGYDKNWIFTDHTQRVASYSNLAPGNYSFLVSSSDRDDFDPHTTKTINFIIKPAPWATWWAKSLYALILTGILAFFFNYFRTKQRLKNEVFKERLEKQKETELNEIKLNFFTTITHEIRTPLNLILSPLQDLLNVASNYDQFTGMRLKIIHRNSFKLYSLINQILDLRKISSDAEKLVITESDLVPTLLDVKSSFNWLAEQKNIRFDYRSPQFANGWFDKDKIEKVVFNLISNAFKYTPTGGTIGIDLSVQPGSQTAVITISDSGIGINPKEQEKVFEMYYQSTEQYNPGTGIGLSLSKKLIEMHGGQISLNSSPGTGSDFIVTFGIGKDNYDPENVYENEINERESTGNLIVQKVKDTEINLSKKSILIIEDNEDQRAYLKDCLLPHFHVLDAENGAEGVEMAGKYLPDIIITDLMMPTLDGMDVCRKIKSHAKTGHIPVIVHSVKNSSQTIKDALLAGADDFIAKPYDYAMLTLKVNNVLKSTNQLMLNIHKKDIINPAEITIPSLDKELLKKIVAVVEKNISDPNFSVEILCEEIGMSRMNLHRKLHTIIGKTASEFIREIRIKRAGQLLASGSKRISEVMDEVGISSNSHFNKYFKEMHGHSPKQHAKMGVL